MKQRLVIEIESESYLEEQYLLDAFPDATWLNIHGSTKFFMPVAHQERVNEEINRWEENNIT